jgi:hypothetical protein
MSQRPNTRVQRTRSSASPPHSPLTRHPLGGPKPWLGSFGGVVLLTLIVARCAPAPASPWSAAELAQNRASAARLTSQMPHSGQPHEAAVLGVVIDVDNLAPRVIDGDESPGGNPLLLIRVERSSPALGVPEILVIQPVDGGVGCGEHRTPEEAARAERKFDIRAGDRLKLQIKIDPDTLCGRLRPCDGVETDMWIAIDFEKVDGAA